MAGVRASGMAVGSMMFCQLAIRVDESSQIGEVRRQANRIANDAGLSQATCSDCSIIATELATNLTRYATGGEVLLRSYGENGSAGLEMLSIDRGPGMANLAKCLEDGYSTGGTPGTGLGAVQRLSTEFDIFSNPPGGTVVLSRVQGKKEKGLQEEFRWGVINLPAPREEACGDTWRIAERGDELALMVADGLGHGPLAAESADVAGKAFEEDPFRIATNFLTIADQRMRGMRGAAIAIAHLQKRGKALRYAGVGNISGSLKSIPPGLSKGLVSHNGTVGVEMRKVQEFDYDCPEEAVLILHSDGLQSRWSLESYPGLLQRHPAIMAGVLYRDFLRGRDDVTVVVVRFSSGFRG